MQRNRCEVIEEKNEGEGNRDESLPTHLNGSWLARRSSLRIESRSIELSGVSAPDWEIYMREWVGD
jgi:hypothetical protein